METLQIETPIAAEIFMIEISTVRVRAQGSCLVDVKASYEEKQRIG